MLCAAVTALVSAAFGPPSLRLGDVIAPGDFWRVFRTWALSDASSVLIVAPLVLTWASDGLRGIGRRELVEGAVGLAVLCCSLSWHLSETFRTSCSRCSCGRLPRPGTQRPATMPG